MITNELNLSMATPTIEQAYAKKGDSGRVLKINLIDAEPEDGTLRIRRPDGVEVTSDAESGVSESGDVITFEAYEEVPLEKLEVDLEPVQNLNGYDAPWVGGGGVNLLPVPYAMASGTELNGVKMEYSADGVIHLTGANSSSGIQYFNLYGYNTAPIPSWIQGGETYRMQPNTVSGKYFVQTILYGSPSIVITGGSHSTLPNDLSSYTGFRVVLGVYGNATSLNETIYPLIKKGSASADWSPYSNICPIYPANGKNLLDSSVIQQGGIASATGAESDSNARVRTPFIFLKGGSYTVSSKNNLYSLFDVYDTNQSYLQAESFTTFSASPKTYTINGDRYVRIVFRNSGGTNITPSEVNGEQLEYGSTATPYVPYQGINIYQQGKNLLDVNDATGGGTGTTLTKGSGSIEIVNTNSYRYASIDFYRTGGIVASGKYPIAQMTLSFDVSGTLTTTWMAGLRYSSSNNFLTDERVAFSEEGHYSLTFDLSQITEPVYLSASRTGNSTANIDVTFSNMQIELGSTATSYEPYNGTTYPLSLGQSVYGGTLDVVSGKLVVDKVFKLVDGSSSTGWNRIATYGTSTRFDFSISDIKYDSGANTLTNMFSKITIGTANAIGFSVHASSHLFQIQVPTATADTVADLMTYFSANNLQIVYVLDTPLEYDLTPTQIKTLLGTNNIWSSGDVKIVFSYGSLFATLPSQATEVVGKCIGDVNFTDISTLPFILTVKENQA